MDATQIPIGPTWLARYYVVARPSFRSLLLLALCDAAVWLALGLRLLLSGCLCTLTVHASAAQLSMLSHTQTPHKRVPSDCSYYIARPCIRSLLLACVMLLFGLSLACACCGWLLVYFDYTVHASAAQSIHVRVCFLTRRTPHKRVPSALFADSENASMRH